MTDLNACTVHVKEERDSLSQTGTFWRAYLIDEELKGFVPLYMGADDAASLKRRVSSHLSHKKITFVEFPLSVSLA